MFSRALTSSGGSTARGSSRCARTRSRSTRDRCGTGSAGSRVDARFDVPTTVAEKGNSLYLVNARFSTPPAPDTEYWITRIAKP